MYILLCVFVPESWYSDRKQIYITYLRQYQRPPTEPQKAGTSTHRIIIYCLSVPALKAHTGSENARNFSGIFSNTFIFPELIPYHTQPVLFHPFYIFRFSMLYFLKILFSRWYYRREFSGLIIQPGLLFFCFCSSDPVYVFGLLAICYYSRVAIACYSLFASWLILIGILYNTGILYVVLYSLCDQILKCTTRHNTTEKQRHTDNNGKADSIQHAPAPMDSDTAKSRSRTPATLNHGKARHTAESRTGVYFFVCVSFSNDQDESRNNTLDSVKQLDYFLYISVLFCWYSENACLICYWSRQTATADRLKTVIICRTGTLDSVKSAIIAGLSAEKPCIFCYSMVVSAEITCLFAWNRLA